MAFNHGLRSWTLLRSSALSAEVEAVRLDSAHALRSLKQQFDKLQLRYHETSLAIQPATGPLSCRDPKALTLPRNLP
jgi:hypothetical protein